MGYWSVLIRKISLLIDICDRQIAILDANLNTSFAKTAKNRLEKIKN